VSEAISSGVAPAVAWSRKRAANWSFFSSMFGKTVTPSLGGRSIFCAEAKPSREKRTTMLATRNRPSPKEPSSDRRFVRPNPQFKSCISIIINSPSGDWLRFFFPVRAIFLNRSSRKEYQLKTKSVPPIKSDLNSALPRLTAHFRSIYRYNFVHFDSKGKTPIGL